MVLFQIRAVFVRAFLAVVVFSAFFPELCVAQEVIPGNFAAIRKAHSDVLTVWSYTENPDILVFDFPNLTQQGRTFNRVTQLAEQQFSEPYPHVLSNDVLAKYIEALRRTQADFAFGHDVLVHELVQFFNLADRDKVVLNPEEVVLRDLLLSQGLIRNWRGFYQALKPNMVVISVPQSQERRDNEPRITEGARYAILLHEMAHGEYYTNAYYSAYCQKFWAETLTAPQRDAWKAFLAKYNYSVVFDELLINEMQAYLMFTPDPASFNAKKLGLSDADIYSMREAFRKGKPPTKLPLRWTAGE